MDRRASVVGQTLALVSLLRSTLLASQGLTVCLADSTGR
jgi:hypothetical protein